MFKLWGCIVCVSFYFCAFTFYFFFPGLWFYFFIDSGTSVVLPLSVERVCEIIAALVYSRMLTLKESRLSLLAFLCHVQTQSKNNVTTA